MRSRVIAITEKEMVLCFKDEAPWGSQIIEGPRDLESYPIEHLDDARTALLKSKVSRSSSVGGAANLLWEVLRIFAKDNDASTRNLQRVRVLTKFGTPRSRRPRRNLNLEYELIYSPGKDRVRDLRKKRFGVQMTAIIDSLVEAGKTTYTEREILEILERNKERLQTKRTSDHVFRYLRGRLKGFGFLIYRD